MESEGLQLNIDYVGSSGVVLSSEQKATLQTSLCLLQNNTKCSKVYFWGRIRGVKDDYFIAQVVGDDELNDKKTYYSKDCVRWGLLTPATEESIKLAKVCKGRFTGDPSYEFEHTEIKKSGEGDDATEEEETITVKEEDRLSAVIAQIDSDAKIVPRGAYVRTPTGDVRSNRSFEGLTVSEAAKLCSYMHFRKAIKLEEKSLLQKANLDKAIDFLDPVDEDIPKGSWSLQFEQGSGKLSLRSLLWIGYIFYHVPGTRKFGSVYDGTGEKNRDLPFML